MQSGKTRRWLLLIVVGVVSGVLWRTYDEHFAVQADCVTRLADGRAAAQPNGD